MSVDGLQLPEGLEEPLQARLEDLPALGPVDAPELDLVFGDPIPGGLLNQSILPAFQQGLFHARDDDQQVLAMIDDRVEEAGERAELVRVEVVDLIDAEDKGLTIGPGQKGKSQQD